MVHQHEGLARLHEASVHRNCVRSGVAELLAARTSSETASVETVYPAWTGIGAVGATVFGIALFGESLSAGRIGCIALIVCGILGLKLLSGESAA